MNESLTSLVAAYSILKAIIQPFKKFDAYKLGLIDSKGNKLKSPETEEEIKALNMADRIVINLKRIIQKTLGGSMLSKVAITTYLLKESKERSSYIKECEVESISEIIHKHYSNIDSYHIIYKLNEGQISEEEVDSILSEVVIDWEV